MEAGRSFIWFLIVRVLIFIVHNVQILICQELISPKTFVLNQVPWNFCCWAHVVSGCQIWLCKFELELKYNQRPRPALFSMLRKILFHSWFAKTRSINPNLGILTTSNETFLSRHKLWNQVLNLTVFDLDTNHKHLKGHSSQNFLCWPKC